MTTFTWNGADLPEELRELPAGRYVISGVEELTPLTKEQIAGIEAAVDQRKAGKLIEHESVRQRLTERYPR